MWGASNSSPVVVQHDPGYSLSSCVWRAIWMAEQQPQQTMQKQSSTFSWMEGGILYFRRIVRRRFRPVQANNTKV